MWDTKSFIFVIFISNSYDEVNEVMKGDYNDSFNWFNCDKPGCNES